MRHTFVFRLCKSTYGGVSPVFMERFLIYFRMSRATSKCGQACYSRTGDGKRVCLINEVVTCFFIFFIFFFMVLKFVFQKKNLFL